MNIKQEELLNSLVQNKVISQKQFAEIAEKVKAGKPVDAAILELGIIDAEELTKFKAKAVGLPYKNLLDKKVEENVLNFIPVEVAENYKIACFYKDDKKLSVGIVDPDNFKAMEAVNFMAKKEESLRMELFLISELSFNVILRQYKSLAKEVTSALESKKKEETSEKALDKKEKAKEEEKLEEVIKSAPVAKIVSVIMRHAVEGRASDIHIEPLAKESRVRYRIDGVLQTSLTLPKNVHNAVVSRIKVLANLKLDETRLPQDGRIRMVVDNKEVDFRVSILPLLEDEKVVMRILDTGKGAPTLEDLGFMGLQLEVMKNNIQKTEGMFLVTGPTGSGKSTTIFSIISRINREGVNISTLEDPIEYFVEGINQSQIRPEIGFTFASGLRTLLRQDPNIIMVGEIRDNETAELAVHAGLTGHLVFSTLHTNDSIGAIPRLLDMKVEPFLLGTTLNMVVAQRLARRICKYCKEETTVPVEVMAGIKADIASMQPEVIKEALPDFDPNRIKLYKGKGCPRCGNQGYSGRVAISEVLDVNDKLRGIIMEEKGMLRYEDVIASQPYMTLKQNGVAKALLGLTTIEEVLRVVFD